MMCVPNRDWFCETDYLPSGPFSTGSLVKGAQTSVWMPIHWDMESHRLHFLKPTNMSPKIYLPSKCTRSDHPRVVDAGKLILARSLMWTLSKMCSSQNQICDHVYRSAHEVVRRWQWRANNGKSWGKISCVALYVYSYRGIFSGPNFCSIGGSEYGENCREPRRYKEPRKGACLNSAKPRAGS